MVYREFNVSEPLQPFINCIWVMQEKAGVFSKPDRLVPDGNIELMLNYGDPLTRYVAEDMTSTKVIKGSHITGQRSSYYFHSSPGKVDFISISFKPGGLSPFVNFPVADITAESIAIKTLKDDFFTGMEERVYEVIHLDEKISIIEDMMLERLLKNAGKAHHLVGLYPMIFALMQYSSVSGFLKEHTINKRKLERNFDAHVGLSPKFLQRIIRFHTAIMTMYRSEVKNFTELAYECGYYDQSHFNNDFKEFSGLTPKQYFSGTCTWDELMKTA